jgi:hypothetical protein
MSVSTPNTGDVAVGATGNVVETGLSVQDVTTTEAKYTAAQVEMDCPARLQEIAREITERLEEARGQTKLVDDHVIAVNKLITEAKELCDVGGFDKFRELFCPQLGKSQAYVRLAIAAGKTTLVEHRTKERERKQRTRANQKVEKFRDVPDKSGLEASGAFTEDDGYDAPDQRPEPAKPRSPVAPGDEAMRAFTGQVIELDRRTAKRPPERFSATAVPVEILARLGKLLTDVANLKKSDAVEPAQITALPDNGAVPADQSAGAADRVP